MTLLKQLGEFGLIDRIGARSKIQGSRLKLGIGDDCAVYPAGKGAYQLITTDALVEKVHFELAWTKPQWLGRKAMSVNISDIAAMGGIPKYAVITLGIPSTLPLKFLDSFYEGIHQICREYNIELAGGDTVSSPEYVFINITLVGEAPEKNIFSRRGARPGDKILVTGTPGDSSLGLKILQSPRKKWKGPLSYRHRLVRTHLDPVPRVEEACLLRNSKSRITSMIDISDGLIQDLGHICKQSGMGAIIHEEWLPKSKELARITSLNKLNLLDHFLHGGEDYELLFTLKPEDVKKIIRRFEKIQTSVTVIGDIIPGSGKVILQKADGKSRVLHKPLGYNHFKPRKL